MKVVLVAPKTDLGFVPEEVQDLINSGLSIVYSFLGDVDYAEFVREIRRIKADVLWMAMHGSAQGWQLKDGLLDAPALASLVRGRFSYVYLNTCSSIRPAQLLQNEGNVDVVATISDVPDLDAYRTGSLMAHALAESGDFRDAYEESRPGENRFYIYLTGSKKKV